MLEQLINIFFVCRHFFYRIVMYIHVDVYVFAYVIHIDFLSYTICLNQNACPFIHR